MMIARISFRIFIVCLLLCASMMLGAVWFEHQVPEPFYFQVTASLFIVGLAAFLIWFSRTLLAIRALLEGKE